MRNTQMDLSLRTRSNAVIKYITPQPPLSSEEANARTRNLRKEFRKINQHIPRADDKFFLSTYMDDFNKKRSMTKETDDKTDFNRDAQPFLLTYFFAYSLFLLKSAPKEEKRKEQKSLLAIKDAFREKAKEGLPSNNVNTHEIISDLENSIRENLVSFCNHKDDGNDPVTPPPERHAA